jgi:hydrophobe/amphiphile efflux-1 (HAE1) family protein
MILSDVSIRRPVFAVMMAVALLVLGITSYFALSLDLMPDVDFPYVVVTVVYPGASAESVELDVTRRIEDAVTTISGVKHVQSTAQEGFSLTIIEFTLETRSLDAATEVRDKVSAIRAELPESIEPPVIQRFDPADMPIMAMAVSGRQSLRDLTDYVDDVIRPRLESITGVGAANIVGGAEREIQVRLDPERLRAFDITPLFVAAQLQVANVEIPAGRMIDGSQEWTVRTMGRFKSVDEMRDMVVFSPHGRKVRLGEIATVIDTEKEPTSTSRLDGKPSIGIEVRRQSGANTVRVADEVKAELARIERSLPAGMEVVIATDNSQFIRTSVDDVLHHVEWGGLLAVLVIFLFLANIRSTLISAIAIPTSIIATFTMMRLMGLTLNMMTLMGISLAVGLLIDDAIVIIENINRHIEMGKKPMQAAHDATDEIGLAVAATTFTIIVVFLPVAFMSGIVGRFFYAFGLTVAFAVAVSLFIAFTLTPMLSSRFLGTNNRTSRNIFYRICDWWSRGFKRLEQNVYRPALRWCLGHRFVTIAAATVLFVISLMLIPILGTEFIPTMDQGVIYVTFEGQAGNRLETTIEEIAPVEEILKRHPEVVSVLTTIGSGTNTTSQGTLVAKLKELDQRELSAVELIRQIRQELKAVPGFFFIVEQEESHGGGRPVELSVRGPDLRQLELYSEMVVDKVKTVPGVVDVKSSQEAGKPEMQVYLDRDMVSDLGLNTVEVAQSLRLFLDGSEVSRFKDGDDEYDIRVQVAELFRRDPGNVGMLALPSAKEIAGRDRFTVPLEQVADIRKSVGPAEINRYDRVREIRVSGSVVDRPAGDARAEVQMVVDSLGLLPGYSINAVGEAEIQQESFGHIFTALILAVIFIYLILASQYNSFIDPFSIMVSLPLAIVGAVGSLLLFRSPFSVISMIGIILLMGLVTKNGILLIDFTKQRREKGMERNAALMEAGPIRFRPIVMTSLATIFGMLLPALGLGAGAEMRAPIARAVVGGMISSTVLTLLVIPVVYTYLDDLAHGNVRAILGLKPKPGKTPQT